MILTFVLVNSSVSYIYNKFDGGYYLPMLVKYDYVLTYYALLLCYTINPQKAYVSKHFLKIQLVIIKMMI